MGMFKRGRPSGKSPPSRPGWYRFVEILTGLIVYVGETSNLKRRRGEQHRSGKPISWRTHRFEWKAADGRSTSRTRREHESRKIEQSKPPLNRRGGGGGRKADR